MGNAFKPLRFTGTVVTVSSFAFQIVPALLAYLSPPYDIEYKLFLVFAVYLPAAIVLMVLQARFLSNAIENLQVFKTGITAEPNYAWASAIPFVNFFFTPWLLFTVHERTMSLSPQSGNTSDRSGYLTLACWGTFIGAIAINAIAEGQPAPDARVSTMLFGTAVGMVSSALTKRIVGEIVQTQEARAGLGASAVAAKPAMAASPAKPAGDPVPKSPVPKSPAPGTEAVSPKPLDTRIATAEAKAPPRPKADHHDQPREKPQEKPRSQPLESEADDTIVVCPKCGAGIRASESTAGIVACPMCGNIFDAEAGAGELPAPQAEARAPTATIEVPVEKSVDVRQERSGARSGAAAETPHAALDARPRGSPAWTFAALAFALAAPLGTFVLASEWGDVSETFAGNNAEALSKTYMMRAGALSAVVASIAAAGCAWLRGARLSAREAGLIWIGWAMTFAMAAGLLFNKHEWLALGDGPDRYFFGGVPLGLVLSGIAGALLRRRSQQKSLARAGLAHGQAPSARRGILGWLLTFIIVAIVLAVANF